MTRKQSILFAVGLFVGISILAIFFFQNFPGEKITSSVTEWKTNLFG